MSNITITTIVLLEIGENVLVVNDENEGLSFPCISLDSQDDAVLKLIDGVEEQTGLTIRNPINKGIVSCLLNANGDKHIFLLFKSNRSFGAISKKDKRILWMKKSLLMKKDLSKLMQMYIKMFEENCERCEISYENDFEPCYIEEHNICRAVDFMIPECVSVIRDSFMTVASELGLTPINASQYVSFSVDETRLGFDLHNDNNYAFVYYKNMKIVGFFCLTVDKIKSECELRLLSVLPEFRGCGIGSRLLEHAIGVAKEKNCKVINAITANENATVKSWLFKRGFIHSKIEKYDFLPFHCAFLKRTI